MGQGLNSGTRCREWTSRVGLRATKNGEKWISKNFLARDDDDDNEGIELPGNGYELLSLIFFWVLLLLLLLF